jgi:hypothetical protein
MRRSLKNVDIGHNSVNVIWQKAGLRRRIMIPAQRRKAPSMSQVQTNILCGLDIVFTP